jgi:hypothetical protein
MSVRRVIVPAAQVHDVFVHSGIGNTIADSGIADHRNEAERIVHIRTLWELGRVQEALDSIQ